MESKDFGEYIRKLRNDRKLTIRQLELYSQVSNAYISQLESGKRGVPSPEILKKLAKPLGVEHEELMIAAGHIHKNEKGLSVAEEPSTYQTFITTNYDELLNKISKEFGLDLKQEEDQNKLLDALHIVIKIHGALK
ncbi:hypothetical protein A8709_32435 [Paenibacillus pectinilyticus]|uniref:HTH cro/C1-type domain-containing protein n=1 Tax=Paenibacillus pectinilyticus TaxID=512399 RepID=A0A1C0ZWP2_9BACL|nr:helix-turn-helix domain-containing protein [Paenibacillus pectinilyticus]OCT12531.1 hypothetical protein A8709_32435 [Paenibacillus pectinilyticus]